MLAFPFLSRGAAVGGNSFVHMSVSTPAEGARLCVLLGSSEGCEPAQRGLHCLCLPDEAFTPVVTAERGNTEREEPNQAVPNS